MDHFSPTSNSSSVKTEISQKLKRKKINFPILEETRKQKIFSSMADSVNGPRNDICPKCQRARAETKRGFTCRACRSWHHCKRVGINKTTHDVIKRVKALRYFCTDCEGKMMNWYRPFYSMPTSWKQSNDLAQKTNMKSRHRITRTVFEEKGGYHWRNCPIPRTQKPVLARKSTNFMKRYQKIGK